MIVQLPQTGVGLGPVLLVLLVVLAAAVGGLVLLINMFRRGGSSAVIAGIITAAVVLGVPVLLVTAVFFLGLSAAPVSQPASVTTATVRSIQHPADAAPTRRLSTDGPISNPPINQNEFKIIPPPVDTNFLDDAGTSRDRANTLTSASSTWRPAQELLPDATADLYPSQRDAEHALAAAIAQAYGQKRTRPLTINHAENGPPTQAYHNVPDALRQHGVPCEPPQPNDPTLQTRSGILLTLDPPTEAAPVGMLTASDHDSHRPTAFAFTARFVDKPWLTDLAAHRINTQSPDLVIALHGDLETTESAARAAALSAAADLIAPRLAGRRDDMPRHPHRPALDDALNNTWTPRDSFTQRLDRPYGPVYRTALLVDLSHDPMQQLAQTVNGWTHTAPTPPQASPVNGWTHTESSTTMPTRGTYASILFRLLGLGVLVGLTLLIYHALNRWTRGYRPVPVTTTAVVILLGGAALLGLLFIA